MAYRNKTYVIFDADNDMWAYAYMKGWKSNENLDFNFHDAHDLRPLTDQASDETVFRRLRERFSNARQAVVLIGENTKNLRKFVPWEIGIALELNLSVVGVNLNGLRLRDDDRCPASLRNAYAVYVPYRAAIIQHALDQFPTEHAGRGTATGPRHYPDSVYTSLGL